jgi:hypothetical protein
MQHSTLRLLIAPFLALGLGWSQDARQQLPLPGDGPAVAVEAPVFEVVEAEELWSHPGRYAGKRVRVILGVHSEVESWNPFVTRFGPGQFRCLRGWSDQQQPWLETDFEHPRLRVFARRGSAAEWALDGAERYQRFELSCVVRAVFGDVPWLEVVGAKPLLRRLGDGTLLHASRGLDLMQKELWEAARLELQRATAGALPEPAREHLEALIERCVEQRDAPRLPLYERR